MIQTKIIHICSEEMSDAERILNSTLQEIQRNGNHVEDIREISIKGVPRVAIIYDDFTAPEINADADATDADANPEPVEPVKEERPRMVISTTPSDGKFMIVHHVADVVDAKKWEGWQVGCNGDRVAGMDNTNLLVIDTWSDSFLSDKLREYVNTAMSSTAAYKTRTTRFTIHEALIGTSKSAEGETSKYVPGKIMATVINTNDDISEICKQLFEHTIEYMQKQSSKPSTSQEKKDDNK